MVKFSQFHVRHVCVLLVNFLRGGGKEAGGSFLIIPEISRCARNDKTGDFPLFAKPSFFNRRGCGKKFGLFVGKLALVLQEKDLLDIDRSRFANGCRCYRLMPQTFKFTAAVQ